MKHKGHKQTKKKQNLFVLTHYFCAWVLPWRVVDIPSDTPLKKTDGDCQAGWLVNPVVLKTYGDCRGGWLIYPVVLH